MVSTARVPGCCIAIRPRQRRTGHDERRRERVRRRSRPRVTTVALRTSRTAPARSRVEDTSVAAAVHQHELLAASARAERSVCGGIAAAACQDVRIARPPAIPCRGRRSPARCCLRRTPAHGTLRAPAGSDPCDPRRSLWQWRRSRQRCRARSCTVPVAASSRTRSKPTSARAASISCVARLRRPSRRATARQRPSGAAGHVEGAVCFQVQLRAVLQQREEVGRGRDRLVERPAGSGARPRWCRGTSPASPRRGPPRPALLRRHPPARRPRPAG